MPNWTLRCAAFADSFIDRFHLPRVRCVLVAAGRRGDRRLELWTGKLDIYQDGIRHRLEGMLRASSSHETGSSTAFDWAASAMANELGAYLEWVEHGLLPELRVRLDDGLDRELIEALELDAAGEVSLYAQAEGQLMALGAASS